MEKQPYLGFFYKSAIFIAFFALLASVGYLFYFLFKSPPPNQFNKDTMMGYNAERRMALISTAFFIAMSFGFLGFALFLIDAKGELEGEGSVLDYKIKIAKVSPGIFAMLCATVIIVTCANFRIKYSGETEMDMGSDSTAKADTAKNHDKTLRDTSKQVDVTGMLKKKKPATAQKK
jgi:hypothetical protein